MSEKMKPWIAALPVTREGKTIAALVIISILLGIAPVVLIFNFPKLVYGIPLLMFWVILLTFVFMFILKLADKWGVH